MQSANKYNFDDFNVGRWDLNHSECFFSQKHSEHEKNMDVVQAEAEFGFGEGKQDFEEMIKNEMENESKENDSSLSNKNNIQKEPLGSIKKEQAQNEPPGSIKKEAVTVKVEEEVKKPHKPKNIQTEWSQPSAKQIPPSKSDAASVYNYKDIYQQKKEQKMKQLLQEEKKMRVFHSRPAPNFNACHEKLQNKLNSEPHRITEPVTPMVLKKSKETDEKRRQRMEEWKKRNQPLKFTSRDPAVLNSEPFKPKKRTQPVMPQPFNLHVEKRLEERKQFDELVRQSSAEKKKQEEEGRKKQEEEIVKELRKLATFKARPNPFK